MEISSDENSQQQHTNTTTATITTHVPPNDAAVHQEEDHHDTDNLVPDPLNNGGDIQPKGTLELIASTGKFWLDWDKLKIILSFQLKQVLSEYAEAKMSIDQQSSALGETFVDLVERLDEALCSFFEGPPFTLQRLCEILLTARSIYPNLRKLALALEKNLLVTSTLTKCTDPCPPPVMQISHDEPEKVNEETELPSPVVPNGVEVMIGDGDEIMAEVEETDVGEDMTIDMEALEEIVGPAESSPMPENNDTEQPLA